MTSIVKCDNCPRSYQFAEAQAGTAWIRVEVLDGDEEPNQTEPVVLMTATFCCPECAEDYLCNPELMGTIRFPDPIGCHGAREANFPIISRDCHDQMHSSCCGRAVKECQCYCHAEKADPFNSSAASSDTAEADAIARSLLGLESFQVSDPLRLPPLNIVDDRTFKEKLRDGDVSLEPDEVYCDVCTWPKRLCICAASNKCKR